MSWASTFTTTHMNMRPHRDAHTYPSRHIHTRVQSRHTRKKMENRPWQTDKQQCWDPDLERERRWQGHWPHCIRNSWFSQARDEGGWGQSTLDFLPLVFGLTVMSLSDRKFSEDDRQWVGFWAHWIVRLPFNSQVRVLGEPPGVPQGTRGWLV